MFKTILLSTDLSENSKKPFALAKDLATKYDAKIILIAVVEDPAELALFSVIDQPNLISCDIQKKILDEVKKDLIRVSKDLGYPNLEPVVLEGKGAVHTALVRYAKENDVDLIIMASKGRTGLRRLVMGSVSEKVLREAPCPVLLIPSV